MSLDELKAGLDRAAGTKTSAALALLAGYVAAAVDDSEADGPDAARAVVAQALADVLRRMHETADRIRDWADGRPDHTFDGNRDARAD